MHILYDAEIVKVWVIEGDINRDESGPPSDPESFLKFIDDCRRFRFQRIQILQKFKEYGGKGS